MHFQTFNTANGWGVALQTTEPDTTYNLQFHFGRLIDQDFPEIELSDDTLYFEIITHDSCLVCGGKGSSVEDTLYIYSNDPLESPGIIPIDLAFFVGVDAVPGVKPFSIQVYPNPAREIVFFELEADQGGQYNMEVFNLIGQEVYRSEALLAEGETWFKQWSLQDKVHWGAGVYYVRVSSKHHISVLPFTLTY
jgi:hypothetical protein